MSKPNSTEKNKIISPFFDKNAPRQIDVVNTEQQVPDHKEENYGPYFNCDVESIINTRYS